MKWRGIKEIAELTICPWCQTTITSTLFISKSDRIKLECNSCGCLMYENRTNLWYKVPDKIVIKQKELTENYGRRDSVLESS